MVIKMNNKEKATITYLKNTSAPLTQRKLAKDLGLSVGNINEILSNLKNQGLVDDSYHILGNHVKFETPDKAVILAAGYGIRMVPINNEVPKGLLEINGEVLIERLIKQLHQVGIMNISVVVGFMKEQYEYLIDEYNVDLIVNSDYAEQKSLHSLELVADKLENSYIIPCDIYASINPFNKYELGSWYMVSDLKIKDTDVKVNRNFELVKLKNHTGLGNKMIGIAYISKHDSNKIKHNIIHAVNRRYSYDKYWEIALEENSKYFGRAKIFSKNQIHEINTYEDLRELDDSSNHLKSDAINIICETLKVNSKDITNIQVLKKGMTNRSFLFEVHHKKYIMRIPGEGSNELINRQKEKDIYHHLKGTNISENVLYLDGETGYKITEFIVNSTNCNAYDFKEVSRCMGVLRDFHKLKIKLDYEFNLEKQIEYYEKLRGTDVSVYRDYQDVKRRVMQILSYINSLTIEKVMCHIDANADNFIIAENGDISLIDWEYAGMQDPHLDIAMFGIYAMYSHEEMDHLIDIYFEGNCPNTLRTKIYAYIAIGGLIWSNWCEYKHTLGVDFGEYSLKQYRYAKEYSKEVLKRLEQEYDKSK